jgi:predicted transcriptional regulator
MSESETPSDVAALTVQLLSAYLANNTVASADLAGLIKTTRAALVDEAVAEVAEPEAPTYAPAVSVRKSLASPDHIISLIDGKAYKTLKRHLSTHGLTPESYRERYKLPASYPMVAPSFAAHRRAIAEKIGLGNRRRTVTKAPEAAAAAAAPAVDTTSMSAPVAANKSRKAAGRKSKATFAPTPETAPAKAPATAPIKKAAAKLAVTAASKPAVAPEKAAPASESAPVVKASAKKAKAAPSGDAPAPKRRPRMAREPKPTTT